MRRRLALFLLDAGDRVMRLARRAANYTSREDAGLRGRLALIATTGLTAIGEALPRLAKALAP
jgi:hypothetical protein